MTKQKQFNNVKPGSYLVIRTPSRMDERERRLDVSARLLQIERYNEEPPYFLVLPNTTAFYFEPLKKDGEGRFLVPTIAQRYYWKHNPRKIVPRKYHSSTHEELIYDPNDEVVVSDNLEDIVRVFAEDPKLACYEALVRFMLGKSV